MIIKLLLVALLVYLAIVALLYYAQTWLIFPGAALPSRPFESALKPERLELATPDGVRLHGLLFCAKEQDADLVIGFGGNAQDAEFLGHDLEGQFPGLHVAVFHYRGYGPSGGRPGEAAVLADALLIHDHLVQRLQPRRVFAVGISLGSSVAAYLSKQRELAGLILVTPFDSIEAIAKETYFWLPVGLLLRHKFPTIEFMRGNPTSVAVIAAAEDRVVRHERTKALTDSLENLVFSIVIPDSQHNTIGTLPAYEEALGAALYALTRAGEEAKELAPADAAS